MSKLTKSKQILIVEDDSDTCEAIEVAVTMEGYSARVAQDQHTALEFVTADEPAAILLDYYGLDGDAKRFVTAARAINRHVPIVLMTGARDANEKAHELGLRHCLPKPFDLEKLLGVLRELKLPPLRNCEVNFSPFS
jgi:DNA-binding response OmpR family regulator